MTPPVPCFYVTYTFSKCGFYHKRLLLSQHSISSYSTRCLSFGYRTTPKSHLPPGLRTLATSRSIALPLALTCAVSSDMRASSVPLSTTASNEPSSYLHERRRAPDSRRDSGQQKTNGKRHKRLVVEVVATLHTWVGRPSDALCFGIAPSSMCLWKHGVSTYLQQQQNGYSR